MDKELIFKRVFVTPEIAEEMLRKSEKAFDESVHKQRTTRQVTVNLYAKDMENGAWNSENGETIKVTPSGAIVDGLHRLKAVAESNVEGIYFYITEVQDESAIATIDIGNKRSLESVLEISGKEYEKGAASIVRSKLTLDTGKVSQGACDAIRGITRIEQLEEYENNSAMYDYIAGFAKKVAGSTGNRLRAQETGSVYAHLYFTGKYDQKTIEGFFDNVCNANPMSKGSIYSTFLNNMDKSNKLRGSQRTKEFITVWNSYLKNRTCNRDLSNNWFIFKGQEA